MSLRTKLTVGLGFLFLIIFALSFYSSYDIEQLSRDAERILRDNYDSLSYCKNMLIALEDMRTTVSSRIIAPDGNGLSSSSLRIFETSQSGFESNLKAEKNNITEIHEGDYVAELTRNYGLFLNLCMQINKSGGNTALYFNDFLPAYSNTRQTIININDVNMQAIERKNLATKHNADNMISTFAAVGAIFIILALLYFWYFPFYVSNTISFLAKRMKELLRDADIKMEEHTRDEAFILLQSINLLHDRLLTSKNKEPVKRRARTKT